MGKTSVKQYLCSCIKPDPWGCLPLAWGYIHVYDHYFQTPSLKPHGQSKPTDMWNHPRVRGTKVYLGYLGPMTKMTDTPIYGESPSKIFSRSKRPMTLKPGMKHWVLGSIKIKIKIKKPYLTSLIIFNRQH